MKQFKSTLAFIGFLTVLKAFVSLIPQPQGTVTIVHEEVEITHVQDATTK
jgi:hypothetical protein